MDLFRLSLGLQSAAVEGKSLNTANRRGLVTLVGRYMNLSSQLLGIPSLCRHVKQVPTSNQLTQPFLELAERHDILKI